MNHPFASAGRDFAARRALARALHIAVTKIALDLPPDPGAQRSNTQLPSYRF